MSLALTAQALTIDQLGSLILALSVVTVIDKLSNFQSWQAYIKFSTDIAYAGSIVDQYWLYKFCLTLDTVSALAGTTISLGLMFIAYIYFGLDYEIFIAGCIFSLTIATNITGTFIGILRISKQYTSIAKANIGAAALKLLIIIILYMNDATFIGYCVAWASGLAWLHCITIIYGHKLSPGRTTLKTCPTHKATRIEVTRFIISSSLQGSVKTLRKEGETLLIGVLLGTAAVAVYKIARQTAQIIARLIDPISQTLLPTITELLVKNQVSEYLEYRRKIHWILASVSLSLCALWATTADTLLSIGFSDKYTSASTLSTTLMIAASIAASFATLPATLLAKGKASLLLKLNTLLTLAYFTAFVPVILYWGINAAGITSILYQIAWYILLKKFTNKELNLNT